MNLVTLGKLQRISEENLSGIDQAKKRGTGEIIILREES